MLDWVKNNLVLSICIVAIVVSLIAIVIILIVKKCRKKKDESGIYQDILNAFCGIENIVEVKCRESRLSLVLMDYNLIDENVLKEKGISSSIRMTNKITYVIGNQAKKIEEYINEKMNQK